MIYICVTLLLISSVSFAVMDSLQHHYNSSIFKKFNNVFWNPAYSWRNKYKLGNPKLGEKFPGSTTVFVMFTDAWHLFKFFAIKPLFAIIFLLPTHYSMPTKLIIVVVGAIIHQAVFEILYSIVFRLKK